MKVLLVLALAIFSVCNADVQNQGAPMINLEQMKDGLLDYLDIAFVTAAKMWEDFRNTELGQDVSAKIHQSTASMNQDIAALTSQDFMIRLIQEAEKLKVCLKNGLTVVGSTVQPFVDELAAKLRTQVEAMIPETRSLQKQLTQKTQGIRLSLIPYRDGMKAKLYDGFHFPRHAASKASTHQLFLPSLLIVYLLK